MVVGDTVVAGVVVVVVNVVVTSVVVVVVAVVVVVVVVVAGVVVVAAVVVVVVVVVILAVVAVVVVAAVVVSVVESTAQLHGVWYSGGSFGLIPATTGNKKNAHCKTVQNHLWSTFDSHSSNHQSSRFVSFQLHHQIIEVQADYIIGPIFQVNWSTVGFWRLVCIDLIACIEHSTGPSRSTHPLGWNLENFKKFEKRII